jgi:hypothetical protein
VRHQQHRAIEADQRLFEHGERREVEVVGWLVEHHDVGLAQHQPCDQEPALLAARELSDAHAHLVRLK